MISGYRFLRDLGHGGFSTVYLAEQPIFDRYVAVKVMHADLRDPDAERRFIRECRATGRLTGNPNIITVFDAGTTDDHRPYIAMEYLPAGTIRQRVAEEGPLPVRDLVTIALPVTSALRTAHEHGILHRDLKPANILLRGPNDPVLSDFGIASITEGMQPVTVSTAFTAGFAAPEVLVGEQPNTASDVFGLGATLFALLTDRTPFPGRTPIETYTRILSGGGPDPLARPDVPPALETLLIRMLTVERDRRPGLDEVSAELEAIFRSLGPDNGQALPLPLPRAGAASHGGGDSGAEDFTRKPAGPPRPGPHPTRPSERARRRALAVAGLAVLLLAGVVGLFLVLPSSGDDTDRATGGATTITPGATGPVNPSTPAQSSDGVPSPTPTVSTGPSATATPSAPASAPVDACTPRARTLQDYKNRTFDQQYMCPISVSHALYANISADQTGELDDSAFMNKDAQIWVICQVEGRPNPPVNGHTNTFWLYTQGDRVSPNEFGYSKKWGYLPATAVSYGQDGEPVPGVEVCGDTY